jgi:hypothetical protein
MTFLSGVHFSLPVHTVNCAQTLKAIIMWRGTLSERIGCEAVGTAVDWMNGPFDANANVPAFPPNTDFTVPAEPCLSNPLYKRCGARFFGRNLHSRGVPLDPMHVRLKLYHACHQRHTSRVSTFLTG